MNSSEYIGITVPHAFTATDNMTGFYVRLTMSHPTIFQYVFLFSFAKFFICLQAIGGCILDAVINDCFLHLVANAPKLNKKLLDILTLVLDEYEDANAKSIFADVHPEIRAAAHKVGGIFKGLAAILIPDVP